MLLCNFIFFDMGMKGLFIFLLQSKSFFRDRTWGLEQTIGKICEFLDSSCHEMLRSVKSKFTMQLFLLTVSSKLR